MSGRKFYIDHIMGDDSFCGTSQEKPWKTIEKANSQQLEPGDEVLFCRGRKWKGMLVPHGNGGKYAPIHIAAYGEGEKPEIDGAGAFAGILLEGVSHYAVEDIRVANRAKNHTVRQGICIMGSAEGITENIVIKNCEVCEVAGQYSRNKEPYHSMYWNGGIYVTMPGRSSSRNHLHHIHILNNYIHDVWTSGIRVNQEEDFINDIHHTCIVVRGNRIERTGSDGIIVANSISPLIDRNCCYDAGALGTKEDTKLIAGIWICATSNALIQYNEVARTRLFDDDGTAFDTDWGTEGTTVIQYNYTHDNEGGFWLDCSSLNYNRGYEKTILRYNISLGDGRGIGVYDKGLPVEFYGNLFAFERPASVCIWGEGISYEFRNNHFLFPEKPCDHWGKAVYQHNYYEKQPCPWESEEVQKGELNASELLEGRKDGAEWLENVWELLVREGNTN